MVKVQKPLPKSLDKMGKAESATKKKSAVKAKSKAKAVRSPDGEKKVKNLLTKAVKDADIAAPVKVIPKAKKDVEKVKEKAQTMETAKIKGKNIKSKTDAAKRGKKVAVELESPASPEKTAKVKQPKRPALVLAPPESPPITKPPSKAEKVKTSNKKALILAPPESPAASKPPTKADKAKQPKKRALALAPPESPAVTEPPAKARKTKRQNKPALILAPLESPAADKPAAKVGKAKQIKKVPLILPPPESPAADLPPVKAKKTKKQGTLIPALPQSAKPQAVEVAKQNGKIKPAAKKNVAILAGKPAAVPEIKQKKQTAKDTIKQKPTKPKNLSKAAKTVAAKIKPIEPSKSLTKKQRAKTAKRAFQKQQRTKKAGDAVDKKPKHRTVIHEPVNFDDAKFHAIISKENVQKIAKALKIQVAEEVKKQKTSIFSDYRYFLSVASFKIANAPRRMVKLNLKHSIVSEGDDVAIIVPDLQRGAKVDYEPTIHHYEDLFREAGIKGLKVVPFNQLRNEMGSFEQKRKFCNTYDYFLCDGRLVGQAHSLLGKITQKARSVLHAVQLDKSKETLKGEIERGLRRTAYRQIQKGDLISLPIGNHTFNEEQLAENIVYVVEQLKTLHPGSYANVRSMHLKIDIKGTSSLPLYISVSLPPAETPNVIGPREQRMLKLKKDANKSLANFTLTKEAKLIKLNAEQIAHKRKLREAHEKIMNAEKATANDDDDDDDGDDDEVDDENDENEGDDDKGEDEANGAENDDSDDGADEEDAVDDGADEEDAVDDGADEEDAVDDGADEEDAVDDGADEEDAVDDDDEEEV